MDPKQLLQILRSNEIEALERVVNPYRDLMSLLPTTSQALAAHVEQLSSQSAVGEFLSRQSVANAAQEAFGAWSARFGSTVPDVAVSVQDLVRRHTALVQGVSTTPVTAQSLISYLDVLRAPSISVQEALRGIFGTADPAQSVADLFKHSDFCAYFEPDDTPGVCQDVEADDEIDGSDGVPESIFSPINPSDLGWWRRLSPGERLAYFLTVIGLLLAIPGAINESSKWFSDDQDPSSSQVQQILHATVVTQRTLQQMAELERRVADRSDESARNQALMVESLQLIARQIIGHPCEVRVATALRELIPDGKVLGRMEPKQLVLCLDHRGKWLEVIYDGPNGEKMRGWALKKHLRWDIPQ